MIINICGLIIIGFIIWWFWFSKKEAVEVKDKVIHIKVKDGVYQPARISVNESQPIILEFLRLDETGCAEYVIFETLGINEKLPLNKTHQINLGQLKAGSYTFACQMRMYQGELMVTH